MGRKRKFIKASNEDTAVPTPQEEIAPETPPVEPVPESEPEPEAVPEPAPEPPPPPVRPAAASKRSVTEPWKAENAPGSARRQGLLAVSRGKQGFELRWVRQDAIDRRKAQGYVLATPEDFDATPDENGMIRRNELVLMVVPKETYDARRAAVAVQTKLQKKSAKRDFLQAREAASRQLGHNLAIRGEADDEE